jgi:cytochrome c oxidase subunit 2
VWSAGAHADFALNMTPGATAISQEVYDLHMLIFWICVAIGVVVFGVMFWSIYHHRKSRGVVPAQFHESTLIEVVVDHRADVDSGCDGGSRDQDPDSHG